MRTHLGRVHPVIIARALPSLPSLTRLRLAGEVNEIGGDDLRCRDDEAAAILRALGVQSDVSERAILLERTEGLTAAVALAGLLARNRRAALVEIDGSTPEVAQFLYSEVVTSLTVDEFGFLLATAVFDTMDPEACDEITGRGDSARLLDDLASRNVLVEAIEGGREYRTHPLFREYLRSELRATRPARSTALHRAAAAYYERRGPEDRALHHWIEAGEVDQAWNRFHRQALPRFFEGAVGTVAEWTEALPRDPVLAANNALDMALTLVYMGDPEGAEEWTRLADAATAGHAKDADTTARRAYMQYLLDFARGDFISALGEAERARSIARRLRDLVGRAPRPVRSRAAALCPRPAP